MKKMKLDSWRKYPAKHIPTYNDTKELDLVLSKVKKSSFGICQKKAL